MIYKKDLYVLDLPAAERSSSCVPRQSDIQGTVPYGSIPSMPGLRAMQANPFIHDVNQQDASSLQSGETGFMRSRRPNAGIQHCHGMVEPDGIEPTT